MGVFSKEAMSFKMERKTPFASHLKSLILNHLLHFCPHYSDDVLAEYITVLVCNGKNQNQAKDDLEAFLGERSREFVSWLWHLLLKFKDQLTSVTSSEEKDKIFSNPSDTYMENDKRNGKSTVLHSQGNSDSDNLMGDERERYCSLTKACKSHDMLPSKDLPAPSSTVQSSGNQRRFANGDFLRKVPSTVTKPQTKLVDKLEERSLASSALPFHGGKPGVEQYHQFSCVAKRRQMRYTTNASRRSLPPLPLDSSSNNNKPRRSVWDRLGKSPKGVPYKGHDTHFHVMNKSENSGEQIYQPSSLISKPAEQIGRLSPSFPMPTDRGRRMLREAEGGWASRNDDSKKVDHVVKTISQVHSVNNIRRKRHFGEVNSETDAGTAVGKSSNNQPKEVIQARKRPQVQSDTAQAVVPQVLDVKQRLRQVEIEMAKLRSKQLGVGKDGKTTLSTDSGVVKPTDEDIEMKTVFVTNVHYKATKEALTLFFKRCGTVVNVVMLDDIPLQRSAYITFESKESTDKALGFSGITFYSRTIMVSKKGDMSRKSSCRFIGKKNPDLILYSMSNVVPDRYPFNGSHLQWRRESLPSHSESPVPTDDPRKKAAESSSQLDPSAAPVSETTENPKPCLTTSAV